MDTVDGKGVVITGGASGIGKATARLLGRHGARVMIADIEPASLDATVALLRDEGIDAHATVCDVSSLAQVEALADDAFDALGSVHVVFNNAGVAVGGPVVDMTHDDWRWVVDVNLWGAIHGVEVFVPRLLDQAEGGHILFTSSLAGLAANRGLGAYAVTKYGIVGLADVLAKELPPQGIGVSVVCPMRVGTKIWKSERNRHDGYGGPEASRPVLEGADDDDVDSEVITSDVVADRILDAIHHDRLYVHTHREAREPIRRRFAELDEAFDALE